MNRRAALLALVPGLAVAWLSTSAVRAQGQKQPTTVKDPVCGMTIDPSKAKGKAEYKGKTYYFCSDDCKSKFEKDPTKYADKAPKQ
jgi:YHS domain-containing protein